MSDPTPTHDRPALHPQGRPERQSGATLHERSGDTLAESRQQPRTVLRRPILAVPLLPGGRPDRDRQASGTSLDLSPAGMGLDLDILDWRTAPDFVVGVLASDGKYRYAGVQVRYKLTQVPGRIQVGCRFGGPGEELLRPENLLPVMQPESLVLAPRMAPDVLDAWAGLGVLNWTVADYLQLCPKCHKLPTFRPGCPNCGNAVLTCDRLLHHYACAYVGPVEEFQKSGNLVCPKCLTKHLAVGADFEHLTGAYDCPDCNWRGAQLEQVAQCLGCRFRFPGGQARVEELKGYHAERLDPLAFLQASGPTAGVPVGAAAP